MRSLLWSWTKCRSDIPAVAHWFATKMESMKHNPTVQISLSLVVSHTAVCVYQVLLSMVASMLSRSPADLHPKAHSVCRPVWHVLIWQTSICYFYFSYVLPSTSVNHVRLALANVERETFICGISCFIQHGLPRFNFVSGLLCFRLL